MLVPIPFTYESFLRILWRVVPKTLCVKPKYGTCIAILWYCPLNELPSLSPETGIANMGTP